MYLSPFFPLLQFHLSRVPLYQDLNPSGLQIWGFDSHDITTS